MRRLAAVLVLVAVVAVLAGWWFAAGDGRTTAAAPEPAEPVDPDGQADITAPRAPAGESERAAITMGAPETEEAAEPEPLELGAHFSVTPAAEDLFPFWGRAVAADDGSPVLAQVHNGGRLLTECDGDGLFRLDALGHVPYRLEAEGFGGVGFQARPGHGSPGEALELVLQRAATLVIELIDATGDPSTLRVSLETKGWNTLAPGTDMLFSIGQRDPSWSESAAADGLCTFVALPPRVPLKALVRRHGDVVLRVAEPLTLEPGEMRRVTWRIGGGARVVGRLLDQDGHAVAGVELWLARSIWAGAPRKETSSFSAGDSEQVVARCKTRDDGSFELDDVGVGSWWLGPAAHEQDVPRSDDAVAPVATTVEVPQGVALVHVELRCTRGLFVEGQVVDSEGEPVSAHVSGAAVAGGGYAGGRSTDDGRFRLGPLVPGPFRLSARTFGADAPSATVVVEPPAKDIVLRLRAGGGIRGVVHGFEPGTRPRIAWAPLGEKGMGYTQVGDEGAFSVGGLAPGLYSVCASAGPGRIGVARRIEVRSGETTEGVEVHLRPGAQLTVRYEGAARYCGFKIFSEGAIVAGDGLHTGTARTLPVPVGALEVVFSLRGDRVAVRETTLALGETGEVLFELD